MMSRLGAGPAAFRRLGGVPRFVDTVYLGAFRLDVIAGLNGYDERSGGNEDAELAYRARSVGGVYLDPAIESTYATREGLVPLARQFFRYGRNRARTARRHPHSISARQLAVPIFAVGLLSPWRAKVLTTYLTAIAGRAAAEMVRDRTSGEVMLVALPLMHLSWGAGVTVGLLPEKLQMTITRLLVRLTRGWFSTKAK